MATATNIELNLYRSQLLRSGVNAYHLQAACKSIARHAARISRHQLNACNGVQRWDVKAQQVLASWTEQDAEKAERETNASRAAIRDALKQFLTPGCVWDWKTDPRAGCVLRIRDKNNRRDCFV
jgi:hypothetical protein